MNKLAVITILLFTCFNVLAQTEADTIEVKQSMGKVFMRDGYVLMPRELQKIMKTNAEASAEMDLAMSNKAAGDVFGFAGGFLVGWPIGTMIGGGKPNWWLAGIGAGLIVVSIPISKSYTTHARNAVQIYNRDLRQSVSHSLSFKAGLTMNGIGFQMRF
jgi:hypothetical protein